MLQNVVCIVVQFLIVGGMMGGVDDLGCLVRGGLLTQLVTIDVKSRKITPMKGID
jgi:hypothetical protein